MSLNFQAFFMLSYPKIIFFGTPDFAVASLRKLIEADYPVVCVVTAPDRPAGRGLKVKASPVKECAVDYGIPVLQPVKLKDSLFLEQLAEFKPDLQIVIAFRMMPREVWSLPRLGTFNLHASLLPQYRGAAPIQRAIINGERETGVTTFLLNEEIDQGRILLIEKVRIGDQETAGELHDRLMEKGSFLVLRTLEGILSEDLIGLNQDSLISSPVLLKTAPKIRKEDCRINWDQKAGVVFNFIRGLTPNPGAFTEVTMTGGVVHSLKIFRARPVQVDNPILPGKFLTDGKSWLKVGVRDGFIFIDELQIAGRKTMNTMEFLRGYRNLFAETHGI
ncbi:MAG: methionyl-tRNA formyltransferase [Bacteroidales bacterium]|nr:methionyl-tRNA formyltransferase [Bacteroidales bacterium]